MVTPRKQLFNHIIVGTCYFLSRGWNTSACRHVSPLRHIILTQSQSETAWYQSILYF